MITNTENVLFIGGARTERGTCIQAVKYGMVWGSTVISRGKIGERAMAPPNISETPADLVKP